MPRRIRNLEQYNELFSHIECRELTHRYALEIRTFEIELYWKRAAYFWTLIAATFVGYFALISADKADAILPYVVSCIGIILSLSWYLVNRGSKYWQENWESHVDVLEDEIVGPLYKLTISKENFSWWAVCNGYPYSVSRLNQITSLFVFLLWILIALISVPCDWIMAHRTVIAFLSTFVLTLVFAILLLKFGISGSRNSERAIAFQLSSLSPSKDP